MIDHSSCLSSIHNIRTREMEGGIEITSFEEACNIVQNCSIIIGMHPDQVCLLFVNSKLLNYLILFTNNFICC